MSTVMLVHGAWCGGWVWDDVVPGLEQRGHRVLVVDQLPSAGPQAATAGGLDADIAHVRDALDGVAEPVTLVGHSYGGMVLTALADHPGVEHSVYLAAFWPAPGQSLMDMLGDGPPAPWMVPQDDGTLTLTDDVEMLRDVMCAEVSVAEYAEVMPKLSPMAVSAFASPCPTPERAHAATYLICTRDQGLPPQAQEMMAAQAEGTFRLESSHCPMFHMADELVGVIDEAIGATSTAGSPR